MAKIVRLDPDTAVRAQAFHDETQALVGKRKGIDADAEALMAEMARLPRKQLRRRYKVIKAEERALQAKLAVLKAEEERLRGQISDYKTALWVVQGGGDGNTRDGFDPPQTT